MTPNEIYISLAEGYGEAALIAIRMGYPTAAYLYARLAFRVASSVAE